MKSQKKTSLRGLPVGQSRKKKMKDPFREAFGRVRDLRSLLPGVPVLALTANVQNKERNRVIKAYWDGESCHC